MEPVAIQSDMPTLDRYQQYSSAAQSTIEDCLSRYLPSQGSAQTQGRSEMSVNTPDSSSPTVIVQQNPSPWWFVPYYTTSHCHNTHSNQDEKSSNNASKALFAVATSAIALGGTYFFGQSKSKLDEAIELREQVIAQRNQLRSIPNECKTAQSIQLEGLLHRCKHMLSNEITDTKISLGLRGSGVSSAILGLAGLYFRSSGAITGSLLGLGTSAAGGLYRTGTGGYTASNSKIAQDVSKKLQEINRR